MRAVLTGALDPTLRAHWAAEERRLMAELIRLGGEIEQPPPQPPKRLGELPARKIARAVIAEWIDWEGDVLRLLDQAASKVLRGECAAPWVYLVGTMPRLFAERERVWSPAKKTKPKPR